MAVTAPQPVLKRRNMTGVKRGSGVVLTGNTIYLHTFVQKNASGKLASCTDNTTARFFGVAVAGRDMTSAGTYVGDGTVVCEVEWGFEMLVPLLTAITAGNAGATAYAKDNFTVGCTGTTNGSSCGVLEEFVAANSGWVSIRSASAVTKGT